MEERFPGFLGTGGAMLGWVGSNEMWKAPGWSFFLPGIIHTLTCNVQRQIRPRLHDSTSSNPTRRNNRCVQKRRDLKRGCSNLDHPIPARTVPNPTEGACWVSCKDARLQESNARAIHKGMDRTYNVQVFVLRTEHGCTVANDYDLYPLNYLHVAARSALVRIPSETGVSSNLTANGGWVHVDHEPGGACRRKLSRFGWRSSEMTFPSQADSSFERNRKGVAHKIR